MDCDIFWTLMYCREELRLIRRIVWRTGSQWRSGSWQPVICVGRPREQRTWVPDCRLLGRYETVSFYRL